MPTYTEQRPGPKPQGFWVSDERAGDDGWKRWCRSEEFHLSGLAYEHQIKLRPGARILYLQSVKDIDDFTAEYEADSKANRISKEFNKDFEAKFPGIHSFLESQGQERDAFIHDIDWPRLAAEGWQGIIITPYCWPRRLTHHTMWYYGWDCASGCIWDMTAIQGIELRRFRKTYAAVVEMTMAERMAELRKITDKIHEDTKDTDHPFPSYAEIERGAQALKRAVTDA